MSTDCALHGQEPVEVVVKKLLLLAGATLLMAACAESSTAPAVSRKAPAAKANLDEFCGSGYIIAYDEYGNPYCVPDDSGSNSNGSNGGPPGPP